MRAVAGSAMVNGEARHIGALDGLRAAAIILVLLFHLTPGHVSNGGLRTALFRVADIGWSGVDLFFVLSGFLITGRLLATRDHPHRFRNFYARRALRIFPLYFGALIACLLLIPMLSRAIDVPPTSMQLPYWLYYTNFVVPGANVGYVELRHFWSLAVEEQFYFVWPALIFLASRRTSRWACAGVILVSLVLSAAVTSQPGWERTATWTPMRGSGLAIGALAALVWDSAVLRRRARVLAVIALAVTLPLLAWAGSHGAFFAADVWRRHEPLVAALMPFVLSVAYGGILVLALELPLLARPLSIAPLRWIARYSYGMYVFHPIVHWPLLRLFPAQSLAARMGSPNGGALAFFAIACAVTVPLSVLSYHAFEAWFLRRKPVR
jgi:peptidoglycan/LPS O-acetylase OafA/YrhL